MKHVLFLTTIALSTLGLIVSLIVHLAAWTSLTIPSVTMGLHGVAMLVFAPAVFMGNRMARHADPKDYWKVVLRGCPPWMRAMFYAFFSYALVNFAIFFVSMVFNPRSGSNAEFRGFSGHWMFFFAAALAICYSARHIGNHDSRARCPRGHIVSRSARYCEECGLPVTSER